MILEFVNARIMASFHREISLYKRLTPTISSRNIINTNNEKSTHIRKQHEAFRGVSVRTQIVGQEWKAFFAALAAFKKTPSDLKARPQNHVTPTRRPLIATDQPGVHPALINGKALKPINAFYPGTNSKSST
jgi:hypothetical protein